MPTLAEDGTGVAPSGDPPVRVLYHFRLSPVAVNGAAGTPIQMFSGELTVGGAGRAFTTTLIAALGPSQDPVPALLVCDTYQLVDPVAVVAGVGAEMAVPPEAAVYHFRLVPVAVSVEDGPSWHN